MIFYKIKNNFFFFFFFVTIFSNSLFADTDNINTLYARKGFVGAKYTAMGHCAEAIVNDVFAIYWNPAGLTGLKEQNLNNDAKNGNDAISDSELINFTDESEKNFFTLGLSAARIGKSDKAGYAGAAFSFFNNILGIAIYSVNCEYQTEEDENIEQAENDFQGQMGILSYAFPLSENIATGISCKYYYQKIEEYSYQGIGGDFGLQMDLFPFIKTGLVVQNIGSGLKQIDNPEKNKEYEYNKPLAAISLAYLSFNSKLIISTGVIRDFEIKETKFKIGASYNFYKYLYISMGYINDTFSGGLSIKNNMVDFAYSISYDNDMDQYNNILSLLLFF